MQNWHLRVFGRHCAFLGALLLAPVLGACGDDGGGNTDSGVVCDQGETLCGTECVVVATDPSHCGTCNMACDPGVSCMAGTCANMMDAMTDTGAPDTGAPDTGQDAGVDTGVDAGPDPAMVERGRYIVWEVAQCVGCHTPANPDRSLKLDELLSGRDELFDLDRDDPDVGSLPTGNLTPHETGLGNWTNDEIKTALTIGRDREGNPLHPVMPYWIHANMRTEDLDAVVAYLRSIPPIDHAVPEPQPFPTPLTSPAPPVDEADIPDTTLATDDPDYDKAREGRYLASSVAHCMRCHTVDGTGGEELDMTMAFQGNASLRGTYSSNLTPHATGIEGWTAENVRAAIREGLNNNGDALCSGMPRFPGLTNEDALAIGTYLTTLEPADNTVTEDCTP